jgi:putative addiction module antidote
MTKLKVTQIGSSKGVILPKELLERLHVDKGDALYATPTAAGGVQLTPYEPEFEAAIKQARSVMRRYRDTLRKLAE